MTLPASGVISLGAIQTEFGGANPIGINEYYNSGSYVGAWNTGVPTSGVISLSSFYGSTAVGPRGIFGGGKPPGASNSNIMDYITIPTPGNATDFGDLTRQSYYVAGVSNGTRGVFGGGYGETNVMDYITIATTVMLLTLVI